MKKIFFYLKYLSIFCLFIFACTKEVDIVFSFPFTLESSYNESVTINYEEPTEIVINPEQVITENIYSFNYHVLKGSGYLKYTDQEALLESTDYQSNSLDLNLEFVGTELGEAEILINVFDTENESESITLNYTVEHNSFTWDINSPNETTFVNQIIPFINILDNTGKDKSVTYDYKVFYKQGGGNVYTVDENGNTSREIKQNEMHSVTPNIYQRDILLTEIGENEIIFEAIDSNGQIIKDSLSINVETIDFKYTAVPEKNAIFNNESTNINFDLEELIGNGGTYETRYVLNSGDGILKRLKDNVEETLSPGVNYSIEPSPYYWTFEATSIGEINMTFFVTNSVGEEKPVDVIINVDNGEFTFNTSSSVTFAKVNDLVSLNSNISEIGTTGAPYTLTYKSSSNSILIIDKKEFVPGDIITLPNLTFIAEYKGLIKGEHNITLSVKNNFNTTVDKEINILLSEDSFVFTAVPEKEILSVEEETNFNFNIVDGDSDATYKMYYTVSGNGAAKISSGDNTFVAGNYYDINNVFGWNFKALSKGNLEYTFNVINNSGATQVQTISMGINATPDCDFTFTSTPIKNTEIVSTSVPINFNINSAITGTDYSMIYTTSESGSLSYNGVNYTPGESIDLGDNPKSLVASYNATNSGSHNLEFSIICDSGSAQKQTASIDFNNIDFNFNSSGDGSLFTNTNKDFNLFLSQTVTDPSLTYEVVFSLGDGTVGNGTIIDSNSNDIVLGTAYPINLGGTEYVFTGKTIGLVNILATVTDSNNQSHSTIVDMNVQNISYNFSGAPQENIIDLNSATALNFSLVEDIASTSNYQLKYVIVNGSGSVLNNGNPLSTNTYYDITKGNFSWSFQSVIEGDVEILATVINRITGEQKTSPLKVSVNPANACNFTFTAIPVNNSETIGTSVPINFNVNSSITGITYSMVYTSSESGVLLYNGNTYTPGEEINLGSNPSGFVSNYTASNAGAHDLEFFITCDSRTTKQETVSIDFSNIDFNLSSSGDGTVFNNNSKTFNLFLSQTITDPTLTYDVIFSLGNDTVGNGTITDSDSNAIVLGTSYPIDLGGSEYNFLASNLGLVDIIATIKDSNNQTHSTSVIMDVQNVSFNFTGAPQVLSIPYFSENQLNFSLIEDIPSTSNYQIKFVLQSGLGRVFSNGSQLVTNTYYDVNKGNFSWVFGSFTTPGNVDLLATVRNTETGEEKTALVQFVIQAMTPCEYTFSAAPAQNTTSIGTAVPINFSTNIIEPGLNYTVSYVSSGEGTFSYNGDIYMPGQGISLGNNPTSFSGIYTGTSIEEHNIFFTMICTGGVREIASTKIDFISADFSVSTSGDGSVFLGVSKDFSASVTQNDIDPSLTYSVRFSPVSGSRGTGQIYDSSNNVIPLSVYRPINLGNTEYKFKGIRSGDTSILMEVRDSNGITNSSTLEFEIEDITYSFSSSKDSGTIAQGETSNFFLNITEPSVSGSDYEIKYVITSTGSGAFRSGGRIINPNTYISANTGVNNWVFSAIDAGVIQITFTARNTLTAETKTSRGVIGVSEGGFNFTAIPSSNSDDIDNCVDVNFNLTELNSSTGPYSMVFTTSQNGSFTYNGRTYQQGQQISLGNISGAFKGCYTGLNASKHDIEYIITNSSTNPITKSEDISITFKAPIVVVSDFSISSTPLLNENDINNCTGISFDLREINGSSQPYIATFTSSLSGTFTYGGRTYTRGQSIPFNNNISSGCYSANETGDHNITFTVSNSNSPIISHNTNLSINYHDYSLNVVAWDLPATFEYDDGGRVGNRICTTFQVNSESSDDINFYISTISETGNYGSIGGEMNETSISGGNLYVLSQNTNHELCFDSRTPTRSGPNGDTGQRQILITVTNGHDTKTYSFTQNYVRI